METQENRLIVTDYRIKVNANSICLTECTQWLGDNLNKCRKKQNKNLENNSTKGILSKAAIKKLKKSINWLIASSQTKKYYSIRAKKEFNFKINFVTLTIPKQETTTITSKQFKVLLNTWLTYHRKYSNLNNYVWKVETHKDGRYHIHIATDSFIHYKIVNSSWNLILKRNGLLEYHYKKFGNYTPPSTDVKAVEKVKKLAAYLAKYMTKSNKENHLFNGRVWGCSLKISKVLKNTIYVCPSEIGKVTRPIFENDIKHIEVFTEPNVFGNKYKVADIYLLDIFDWIKLKGTFLYNLFKEIVLFLRIETSRESQLELELT